MTKHKRWTTEEKSQVITLRRQGLGYKEIAERVRPDQPSAWRKIGEICREYEKRQAERSKELSTKRALPSAAASPPPPGANITQALVSMPREERVGYLMAKLQSSSRGRAILAALSEDQRKLFAEMYHEMVEEIDSLTSAEDQMLMQAVLAYCQYIYAAQMSSKAEQAYIDMLDGLLDDDDPRRQLAGVTDRYKSEMEKKHKEYVTLMDKLKTTRDQRLKNVVDQRRTFGELQREFTQAKMRRSVIKEILQIEKMTDEELKRLLAGGIGPDGEHRPWLIGQFDD